MHLNHWNLFIKPALDCIELSHIVEIGADKGATTTRVLEYCRTMGSRLTTIDCAPSKQIVEINKKNSDIHILNDKTSLEVLPELSDYEAILIDGDHNWYTVYHELKAIEKAYNPLGRLPLLFFHDVAWPYARRDMYYDPERVPKKFRQKNAQKGVLPGVQGLLEGYGLNRLFYNALYEGGPRNGVLTAIEDFVKESKYAFRLSVFNGYWGFALLASEETLKRFPSLVKVFDLVEWSVPLGDTMQELNYVAVRMNFGAEDIGQGFIIKQGTDSMLEHAFKNSRWIKLGRKLGFLKGVKVD